MLVIPYNFLLLVAARKAWPSMVRFNSRLIKQESIKYTLLGSLAVCVQSVGGIFFLLASNYKILGINPFRRIQLQKERDEELMAALGEDMDV